jgi:hypothetical protein
MNWRLIIDEESKRSILERQDNDDSIEQVSLAGGADHVMVDALRVALDPMVVWDHVPTPRTPGVLTRRQWKDKGYLHILKTALSPKGDQEHDDENCDEDDCSCELHMSSDDCTMYETLDDGCSACPYER